MTVQLPTQRSQCCLLANVLSTALGPQSCQSPHLQEQKEDLCKRWPVSRLRPVGRCPDSSAQQVRGMPGPSVSLMQTSCGYPATIPFWRWAILVSIWLGFHKSLEMTALSGAGSLALRCIPLDVARPLSQGQRATGAGSISQAALQLPFLRCAS